LAEITLIVTLKLLTVSLPMTMVWYLISLEPLAKWLVSVWELDDDGS